MLTRLLTNLFAILLTLILYLADGGRYGRAWTATRPSRLCLVLLGTLALAPSAPGGRKSAWLEELVPDVEAVLVVCVETGQPGVLFALEFVEVIISAQFERQGVACRALDDGLDLDQLVPTDVRDPDIEGFSSIPRHLRLIVDDHTVRKGLVLIVDNSDFGVGDVLGDITPDHIVVLVLSLARS